MITVNQKPLKDSVDQAVEGTEVEVVFVASNSKGPLGSQLARDVLLEEVFTCTV